jgi:DNA-binding transcriptional MocR family regulator
MGTINSQSSQGGHIRMYAIGSVALIDLLGDWASGSDPLNEQLASAIGRAIERGDLAAGSRLPSERELAVALGLSRTTIVLAYGRLRDAGLVRSRQGSGTRVVGSARAARQGSGLIQPYVIADHPGRQAPAVGLMGTVPGWLPGEPDERMIEMTIGALRGGRVVLDATRQMVDEDLPAILDDFGYRPVGLPSLREEIASHFGELGVPTEPTQIIVTSGAQQAIDLIAHELVGRDGIVLLENPTYVGAVDAFRAAAGRMIPVPGDELGMRTDLAAAAVGSTSVRAVFVVPTYQNPTGTVLPEERRRSLARLAADSGTLVVEDLTPDVGLGRGVPPPIAAFDRAGRVLTIGSLSKVGWGGLRVGWIRAPQPLIQGLISRKTVTDHGTSTIVQAIARRVLQHRDRLAEQTLVEAASRSSIVVRSIRDLLPDWELNEPSGGLSIWVRLPGADATEFARVAAEHGVVVRPGPVFSPDGGCRDYLRVAVGEEPERLREGVRRLAAAWEASRGGARRERPLLALSV